MLSFTKGRQQYSLPKHRTLFKKLDDCQSPDKVDFFTMKAENNGVSTV
jgi:hypothetical protein